MLVGQRKKSQKYFDLSTFNYNLHDSNPCSSLGVMNFQSGNFFLAHPVDETKLFQAITSVKIHRICKILVSELNLTT